MGQHFHPSTNTLARVSLVAIPAVLLLAGWVAYDLQDSSYIASVGVPREQPVAFSHAHHVAGLGIDCRYCHTSVEDSAFAGVPPTSTCMNCHSQMWTNAQMLEPVRESFRLQRPLAWQRVHDLPDYVYFNHSIHVKKGIGCVTCHGQVDKMPLTWKSATLHMQWCLDCHREPEKHVRPPEAVFDMNYKPAEDQAVLGPRLVKELGIRKEGLTNCTVCHR